MSVHWPINSKLTVIAGEVTVVGESEAVIVSEADVPARAASVLVTVKSDPDCVNQTSVSAML